MNNSLKTILALSSLVFSLQFSFQASAAATCTAPTLTAAQCTKLRTDLNSYIAWVTKYFGTGPLVQKLIAAATADVNKRCPVVTPPSNGYTADTIYECGVLDNTSSAVTSLGLDASLNLTNVDAPYKTACMTQNACLTIASQAYVVFNSTSTARCSDPTDQTVFHFSDADIQTKVNTVLGH